MALTTEQKLDNARTSYEAARAEVERLHAATQAPIAAAEEASRKLRAAIATGSAEEERTVYDEAGPIFQASNAAIDARNKALAKARAARTRLQQAEKAATAEKHRRLRQEANR